LEDRASLGTPTSKDKNRGRRTRAALAIALILVIVVAGIAFYVTSSPSGSTTTQSTTSTASAASLLIAISPAMPLVAPGQTQNYSLIQLSTLPGSGSVGTFAMKASAPAGISVVLNKTSVSLADNPQSVPFQLKADPGVTPGNYHVSIAASSPNAGPVNKTFSVEVVPVLVTIQGLAFHPQNITVSQGTVVSWINLDTNIGCCDPGNHNVVFLSGANSSSPTLKRLDTWSYTFGLAGSVEYYCSIHPYMKGQVTVTG
jgi:plastocyanin